MTKNTKKKGVITVIKIQIREARIQDADFIHRLNCREMGYAYPLEKTIEKLEKILGSPHDKVYVAEFQDSVVGYVHANDYDLLYAPSMKNIMGIAVSSDFKRQGAGTALLKAVEEWAKKSGASGIRLVSGADRTGAHEFYRQFGFGKGKPQLNFKKIF